MQHQLIFPDNILYLDTSMKLTTSFLLTFVLFGNYSFAQRVDSVYHGKRWISTNEADQLRISTTPFEVILNGKTTKSDLENGRSAAYPNNYPAFNIAFKREFKYPASLSKRTPGTVRIHFIVEKDSTLTSFEITKSFHPLIDAEVVRAIKHMKKWIPMETGGQLVRQRVNLSFWIE